MSINHVEVIINGRIYNLSSEHTEEYLQKIASYINAKIIEFKSDDYYKRLNPDIQKTLLELNIADDYFKLQKKLKIAEQEIESKDKELYDLKHDLIASQIKLEASAKEIENLKKEISDNQKSIIRLETELKDLQ